MRVLDKHGTEGGAYFADLLVEGCLSVDLKAARRLVDEPTAQLLGYVRASRREHGLLINLGSYRFETRKCALSDPGSDWRHAAGGFAVFGSPIFALVRGYEPPFVVSEPMKSLDAKLAEIQTNPGSRAFIIADAKDADMAFGVRATGQRSYLSSQGERPARFSPEVWTRDEFGYRNLPEFLDIIREVTRQGLVDIMLMSAYVNELLAIKEGLFRDTHVTPAARANDTTDVWAIRHGCYTREPAQPFRTASIDHIQCGKVECDRRTDEFPGANLGLYSVTFVNDLNQDRETLRWFKEFREEAERKRFRYFLEVFDPNVESGIASEQLGEWINDQILRSLAGVTGAGRPVFLKIVYHGPRALEELVQYDPNMVVGILGGSAGTTYDAFKLIHDAQKHGARVALYGRKINNAEHQLAFIEMLRLITDGRIGPQEAVRAYHGVLQGKGIRPTRPLEQDLELTDQAMSYGGGRSRSRIEVRNNPVAPAKPRTPSAEGPKTATVWPRTADGSPDFGSMTAEQRLAYDADRLKRRFG